ncbi:MAG: V-type ATP synthase subunit D [Planctomycetes bacterium]|nr:V-type ATP synthase subunit D [Planctomycetota bacterium]
MSRIALNKAELQRQQRALKTYRQFLPSLDLKRRQLLAERAAARAELASLRAELIAATRSVGEQLPMLADERIALDGLVRVKACHLTTENRLGTKLPLLERVDVQVAHYSLLTKPHWVDPLVDRLRRAIESEIRVRVAEERTRRLERAVRVITQRVNLFDKVLIPQTRANVRRIQLHLSDAERAGVVRAKIAKSRAGGRS